MPKHGPKGDKHGLKKARGAKKDNPKPKPKKKGKKK